MLNIGLGGACVSAPDPLPEGARLALEIDTPNLWDPLAVVAEVAWVSERDAGDSPVRAGLRFLDWPARRGRALAELLDPHSA